MSSCLWPLLCFLDEEEIEGIASDVMSDIRENIDWEIKRAINEVVENVIGEKSKDV